MCHTVAVRAESRLGPQYGPTFACNRFSALVSAITLSIMVNESRRYARISAFVLAGFGPPMSHRDGGFSPAICFAHASLAHATCFTCSPNVRTSLNSPCVGLKLHLSSGIASARAAKSCSMSFQMKLIESGIVLSCGGSCCAIAVVELTSSTPLTKARMRFLITPLTPFLAARSRDAKIWNHCMRVHPTFESFLHQGLRVLIYAAYVRDAGS